MTTHGKQKLDIVTMLDKNNEDAIPHVGEENEQRELFGAYLFGRR
jgi:hypothetical protein